MSFDRRFWLLLALLPGAGSCTREVPPPVPPVPAGAEAVPDFTLLDHRGDIHTLSREGGRRAVAIVGHANGSRALREAAASLRAATSRFSSEGAGFFLLNAASTDSREAIANDLANLGLEAPVLLDPAAAVAAELGLAGAGEAIVVVPPAWKVAYRGSAAGLEAALGSLLAGKAAPAAPAAVAGEPFPGEAPRLTYARHVAPILREKCVNCHSAGAGYAPYFDSYETVKGWGAMIRETVLTERMPPWSADPNFGPFVGDMSLSGAQKRDLLAWIRRGMARGTGRDPLSAPPAIKHRPLPPKVWELAMEKPHEIGPRGTLDYLFFQVGGPAPYDMWVTAVHTKSSNPRQLHHESLMITSKPLSHYEGEVGRVRDPEEVRKHPDGDVPFFTMGVIKRQEFKRNENYSRFLAFGAGREQPYFFPQGGAIFIPKGYYAILEVHYVGNGKNDQEQTKIELFGHRAKGDLRRLRTLQVSTDRQFTIPPGERRFFVHTDPLPIRRDIRIVGMLSHLHMRGRAVKLLREDREGRTHVLASIPNFDFNWQSGMPLVPRAPILVPAGSKLKAVCEYDNSSFNPLNPDSTREVHHGQTLDRAEMCKFMVTYHFNR